MIRLVTGPTQPPLPLALVKAHLNIHHTDDDILLSEVMMPAAAAALETKMKIALMPQTWRATLPAFTSSISLAPGPVASITSVVYTDASGADVTLDPSAYALSDAILSPVSAWPSGNLVRVTWVAGLGCPPDVAMAFVLLVGHYYKNREATDAPMQEIPLGVESLIARHRYSFSVA